MKKSSIQESILPQRIIKFASVWERFGAFVIDLLIVMILYILMSTRVHVSFAWIFIAWIYEAVQVSGFFQATLGQRTMGIKVSNKQGGSLDFAEASLRHLSKYISFLTACSGYLMVLLDKRRQCLHDKIAESLVVTAESYQAAV